jgi:hypothetical protein
MDRSVSQGSQRIEVLVKRRDHRRMSRTIGLVGHFGRQLLQASDDCFQEKTRAAGLLIDPLRRLRTRQQRPSKILTA